MTLIAITLFGTSSVSFAIDDSFFVPGSPEEVRNAMNQLGPAGLMNIPGPTCVKSILVEGDVDSDGNVRYQAARGMLGTATGQLRPVDGGTEVRIRAKVISDALHRAVMGSPEAMAEKITRRVEANRRG